MKFALPFFLLFVFALSSNATFGQKRDKFHIPAGQGDLEMVKKAVKKGAKIDKKDIAGQTALIYAADGGQLEVVKYLVSQGADVNASSGKHGRGTALIYAAANNHTEIVSFLLENGANINAVTPYQKETAILWATAMGHKEMVELLLEKGADPHIEARYGEDAIDTAKKVNRADILTILQGA